MPEHSNPYSCTQSVTENDDMLMLYTALTTALLACGVPTPQMLVLGGGGGLLRVQLHTRVVRLQATKATRREEAGMM